jgi:Domain of unknown function (DUF4326)
MMIEVLSLRNGWLGKDEVYVGRPMPKRDLAGSSLANPFPVYEHTEKAHAVVLSRYRDWLWAQIKRKDGQICAELMRLKALALAGDLKLKCWCSPLPCHADVIKACIEWMVKENVEF